MQGLCPLYRIHLTGYACAPAYLPCCATVLFPDANFAIRFPRVKFATKINLASWYMGTGNKKYKKPQPVIKPAPMQNRKQQASGTLPLRPNSGRFRLILIAGIAIITFFTYSYTLHNQFTNWDDGLYIDSNPYIKNLTHANLKMILFHNITNNYYHPLTLLSIAANYHFSKMDPFGYYLTNVIIHICNTLLVFLLVMVLLGAMEERGYGTFKGKEWLAAFAALCHGVHPMHVESVAWIAERKDVLYGFFYWLGLITYVKYVKEEKLKWLALVVFLYLCSLASKPLAVIFPLSLFPIDILLKRSGWKKIMLEKAPFFLVSLIGGIWAWKTSDASGSIASFHAFTFIQRLSFAGFSFTMFVLKAFIPFHLCSYYPYPNLDAQGFMPFYFYIAPLTSLLIIAVPLWLTYRSNKNYFRVALFGLGFFLFNVLFVLQFVSVGPALMPERYTSIAYFGIFFMVTFALSQLWARYQAWHLPLMVVPVIFIGVLAYLCRERTKVWHSTQTLWQNVIQQYPLRVETAYKNLGNFYAERNQYDSAFAEYKVLDDIHSTDAGVYSNLANIYAIRGQFGKSLQYYSHALKLNNKLFDVWLDMAITYSRMDSFDLAIKDYNYAYSLDPKSEQLLFNRGNTYLNVKDYDKAIADFNTAISINPDRAQYYLYRGIAETDKKDLQAALNDFLRDLSMEPDNADCLFNLSIVYNQLQDYNNALNYALRAQQKGHPVAATYIADLKNKPGGPKK